MSIVFKILHLPSGDFIKAFRDSNRSTETIFYDSASAMRFLDRIVNNASYISGGPIHDYYIGPTQIAKYIPIPLLAEFELLPFDFDDLTELEQTRVLRLDEYRSPRREYELL